MKARAEDVREWLAYAEADRKSAHNALQMADYRDAAFHCQQAIEKLLKAVIVAETGQRPPYVHDLRTLLRRIEQIDVPEELTRIISDTDIYYTGTRYPGVLDPEVLTPEHISSLVSQMEEVFRWFLRKINFESI